MINVKNINHLFYLFLKAQQTKIAERVLNNMSRDRFTIYEESKEFVIEPECSIYPVNDYVYNYAKKWFYNSYLLTKNQ